MYIYTFWSKSPQTRLPSRLKKTSRVVRRPWRAISGLSSSKAMIKVMLANRLTKNRILCPRSLPIFTKHDRLFFDGILNTTIVVTVVYFGYYNILFRAKTIKNWNFLPKIINYSNYSSSLCNMILRQCKCPFHNSNL